MVDQPTAQPPDTVEAVEVAEEPAGESEPVDGGAATESADPPAVEPEPPADDPMATALAGGYGFDAPSVTFGKAMSADLEATVNSVAVKAPLVSLNKHGLIAGATGTGKTKSLQVMAEELSAQGVPVFLADLKGDLTGLGIPSPGHPRIDERMDGMQMAWEANSYPVELLSISGDIGSAIRVPVSEFGPLLLAKVMDCTETQQSVLQVLFKFADEQGLALLDLVDLVEMIKYLTSDAGEAVQDEYGGMATSTLNVLLRKAMELETQGAEQFFGEPTFEVDDLKRTRGGRGVISVMNLTDMQDRPKIFSTFMMWLLAELYETSPEVGDPDKPVLAFFFDEAHLLFNDASDAMLDAVEMTVRMIRSKGIGVFFVTQNPTDLPEPVLAQLGNRVQHALRAFTPNDKKALRDTADTFPATAFYDVRTTLQNLGTGEALITVLDPDGAPTPTVATRMRAPRSTMDPVTDEQTTKVATTGDLGDKYAEELDRESAKEVLAVRLEDQAGAQEASVDGGQAVEEQPESAKDDDGGFRMSSRSWRVVEDIAATVTPHGKKSLVRSGVKMLRNFLGTRSR